MQRPLFMMGQAHPPRSFFYEIYEQILRKGLVLGSLLPGLPLFEARDFDLLAVVIEQLRRTVRIRTNLSRFVVVIFPGSSTARWLVPRLKAREVEVLDDSNLDISDYVEPAFIRLDGHPTIAAHEFLGRLLGQDLLVRPLSQ